MSNLKNSGFRQQYRGEHNSSNDYEQLSVYHSKLLQEEQIEKPSFLWFQFK